MQQNCQKHILTTLIVGNQKISNQGQWLGFPNLQWKNSTNDNAEIGHANDKKAAEFLNLGQVSVIVGYCPLHALQKKCPWKNPGEVGESKMVYFMGSL